MSPRLRRMTEPRRRLLAAIERCLLGIRYPVDLPDTFHAQCHHALLVGGFNAIREVPLETGSCGRRVDLVVVDRVGVAALELEHGSVTDRTAGKLRDLPSEVLRMVVLRSPVEPVLRLDDCDHVVNHRADLRPVAWLCSGTAIMEEPGPVLPSTELALSRAAEASEARRLIVGERRGPRSAAPSAVVVPGAIGTVTRRSR